MQINIFSLISPSSPRKKIHLGQSLLYEASDHHTPTHVTAAASRNPETLPISPGNTEVIWYHAVAVRIQSSLEHIKTN
jgi:hypothetical protein